MAPVGGVFAGDAICGCSDEKSVCCVESAGRGRFACEEAKATESIVLGREVVNGRE